jgi:hypothetical protein
MNDGTNVKMLAKKMESKTPVYRCGDTTAKSCNLGNQYVSGADCEICIYKRGSFTAGTLNANVVVTLLPSS